jgi:hypothetical protein
MAELLAIGTAAADSDEFSVTAAAPVALYIKTTANAPADGVTFILQYKKADGTTWQNIAALDASNILEKGNIVGAGTFRVSRVASVLNAAGMDYEGAAA